MEMSDYDIVNLASIVEREGLNADQRAHVASVFYNRLAGKLDGLRYLNSDATMMYVTGGEVTADDLQSEDGQFVVTTSPASFPAVCEALNKAGVATDQAEITMVPDLWVTVSDKSAASTVMKFVEALEDLEDVQNVYTNMDVDDAVLKELEKE